MICSVVRPTFSELMAMDWDLASAIIERLPSLEDGSTGRILMGIFGAKKG